MIKHVVLGGGTAGYITALLLQRKFPFLDISLVASKAIGVVGPGEGLTPHINRFLFDVDISIDEFLQETNGTIKNGIHYVGWGTKNPDYLHSFYDVIQDEYGIFKNTKDYFTHARVAGAKNKNLDEINLQSHVSYDNRVMLDNPGHYAFHIDSGKLVTFLEKKASERGIKILDEIVAKIEEDDHKNINKLIFESGSSIDVDFIYDCSGFHRMILGKHYQEKWISASKHLPATSAIAGQVPIKDIPKPYTDATTMKYGWSWKIPLQNRYGCGYVFNNKYISDIEAEEELRELVGNDLKVIFRLNFDSGFFNNILIKNCLGLGLSSSFFEPLEATAIDNVLNVLYRFLDNFASLYLSNRDRESIATEFNNQFRVTQYSTLAFIYLHYMTNKTNTEFWSSFAKEYPIPDYPECSLNDFFDGIENDSFGHDMFSVLTYRLQSWLSIYYGNELSIIKKDVDTSAIEEYNSIVKRLSNMKNKFSKHSDYLKNIEINNK